MLAVFRLCSDIWEAGGPGCGGVQPPHSWESPAPCQEKVLCCRAGQLRRWCFGISDMHMQAVMQGEDYRQHRFITFIMYKLPNSYTRGKMPEKTRPSGHSGQDFYRSPTAGAIISVYGNKSWCERVKGRAGDSDIKLCSGADCPEGEERAQHFVRLWTLKEAYVKAVGRGIGARPGLSAFSVSLHPRSTGTQFMQRMRMVDHLSLPACID